MPSAKGVFGRLFLFLNQKTPVMSIAFAQPSAPVLQVEGSVATITLNRPAQRNKLENGDLQALLAHMAQIEADPAVRVLVLTANVSSEDHQRCTDVGANDLVLKPFERQQLCAMIEEHLLLSPAFMLRLNQPRD
jgi:CheY-like chemotaxis protein